jgi:protein-arginine deiminase
MDAPTTALRRTLPPLAAALALAVPCATAAADDAGPRLLADHDRDGAVTAADAAPGLPGALVLPNLDDDGRRCAAELRTATSKPFRVTDLAACSDASDAVVDGAEDEGDLAPLRLEGRADTPDDATGTIALAGAGTTHARLFARTAAGWSPAGALGAAELRAGVDLRLEATDVVRDRAAWDGTIAVTLTVTAGGAAATEQATLRVAPLVLQSQTAKAQRILANAPQSASEDRAIEREDRRTARSTVRLLKGPRKNVPPFLRRWIGDVDGYEAWARRGRAQRRADRAAFRRFSGTLRTAVRSAGGPRLETARDTQLFVQDQFEHAYASVPAPGGARVIRFAILTAPLGGIGTVSPKEDLVPRLTWPFRTLRGPDAAVVLHPGAAGRDEGYDASGALEATPPVPGAPHGKLLLATSGLARQPHTAQLLHGQGLQPVVRLDTDWLAVGHVDETVAFVPAATPRGWVAVVADPRLALELLRSVPSRRRGTTRIVGTADRVREDGRLRKPLSVRALLGGPVARDSGRAARKIDGQLAVLRRELGLTDADIVRVPVLYGRPAHEKDLTAWTGNVANGVALGERRFLAARANGPRLDGRDLFDAAAERALRKKGVGVAWIDTHPVPHQGLGEVHCYTNVQRDIGSAAWWAAPPA